MIICYYKRGNMTKNNNLLKNPISYIMSLQHLVAMFGATVLVPILTGFSPAVALFTAGVGTLIFHACTSFKVPVFLGSSFAFIPLILQVKQIHNGDLSYAQGGIMVAGALYLVFSLIVYLIGAEKVKKAFPPVVVGPMIVVIGFNLIPVALEMASVNVKIAALTLVTAMSVNFLGKGFFKQLSILIGVSVGYIVSLTMNIVDISIIKNAQLLEIPAFSFPKFSIESMLIIAPVVLAVFMEHVGDITTNGAVVGEDFIKKPGLHKTLLGDGLATIFAGLMGGPANTTYGENTGVLAITKNYNPALLRLAAVFAIFIAFLGKFGAILSSIPVPVMGGISLMLFTMIAYIGIKNIKDNKVRFTPINLIIMLSILIIGLSESYIPNLSICLHIPMTSITLKGLSLSAIVGVVLNAILSPFKK